MRYRQIPLLRCQRQSLCGLFLLSFIWSNFTGIAVASPLDSADLALRNSYALPLRWENVKGEPYWVAGPRPQYKWKAHLHSTSLAPGEEVVIKLPPYEMLRVHHARRSFQANALEFWLSDGSGLYVQIAPQTSSDGRSLLLAPQRSETMLVRVRRPLHQRKGMSLSLFVSRHEPLPSIAPYRAELAFPHAPVLIRRTTEAVGQQFWLLTPEVPQTVTLHGPTRLNVETILPYPPAEAQAQQAYDLLLAIDDQPLRSLRFQTVSESSIRLFIDSHEDVLSGRTEAYIDVPEGKHRLTFIPTTALYVRLLQRQEEAFLLPQVNRPTATSESEAAARAVASRIEEVLQEEQDNRLRDGGTFAAARLRAVADEYPYVPALQQVAGRIHDAYISARDLLPVEKVSAAPQQYGWFLPLSLLAPREKPHERIVAAQHTRALRQRIANAPFLTLPAASTTALVYKVPPRSAPAQLRLLVENSALVGVHSLTVQFDRQDPVPLFAVRGPELPMSAYATSYLEAGLQAFLWQRQGALPLSAAGAQALWLPQPLLQVGVVELPLPLEVREVRIWQTGTEATPLQVALQYTGTKSSRPTEMEYLGAVARLKDEHEVMNRLITSFHEAPFSSTEQHRSQGGENFWIPLVRFLKSQQKTFSSSVAPLRQTSAPPARLLPEIDQQLRVQKTQALEKDNQWLAALEGWAQLVYSGTGEYRRHGLWGRLRALQALGESFLAEQQLRGLMLYGEDEEIRRTATEHLRQEYSSADDLEALLALAAFQALHSPTVTTLRQLVEALLATGEHELALMVGLVLPPADRPLPLLLRAAYGLDWWATFDHFVAQLPHEADRSYWRAFRALAQGDYRTAHEHLTQAGPHGILLAQTLATGQSIALALDTQNPKTRAEALFAWEHWQAQLSGPRVWTLDETLVTDYQGAIRLYNIERDIYTQFYVATPQHPVQLQVLGPARLKVEARPLHPEASTTPLEDWLQIRIPGQLQEVPITNNLPTFGLQVVEDATLVPGRTVATELTVGPGLHTLTLAAKQTRVALRVYRQQPEMPLEVLPPLSRQAFAAVWQAGESHAQEALSSSLAQTAYETTVHLLTADHTATRLSIPPLRLTPGLTRDESPRLAEFDPATAIRLALRFGATDDELFSLLQSQESTEAPLSLEEQVLANARSGAGAKYCARWIEEKVSVSASLRNAVCLAEGEGERLLPLPNAADDEALRQRLLVLLQLAAHNPSQRQRAQILGAALFAAHPQVPGLAPLHAQLTRERTWEPIPAVQTSAGLRTITSTAWKPETPSVRIRRALVPPLAHGEYAVSGQGRLGISLSTLAPTTLLLDVFSEDVEYFAAVPATAIIQVDQQPEQRILLSPAPPPAFVRLPLSSGEHTIYVWNERPVVNQFLRVRVREQSTLNNGREAVPPSVVEMTTERTYYLATHQEPLRFTVAGPQWLRIDEWREERTYSQTRFVPDGWQTMALTPQPQQTEALFRVFQSTTTTAPVAAFPRLVAREAQPVPFPVLDFRSPTRPRLVALTDVARLGRQEDGTWSFMTQFVRQRNFDEDTSVDQIPIEQFLETRATHRFFHEERGGAYSETHLFTRLREHGNPTLGIAERVRFDLNWQNRTPVTLQMSGEGYVQQPGGGRPLSRTRLEWSALVRWEVSQTRRLTPLLDHRPSVSLLTRALSLRRRMHYRPGYVDQDISTAYKADHRASLTLAESLSYRPWLDSEWTTRFALASNETLILEVPDYFSLTSTWKQLLRDTQVDVGYAFRTFFADSDRNTTSFRHVLALDLLQDYWFASARFEFGLSFRHDMLRNENTFTLAFTWHLDQGRNYRDFRPGVVDFLNLRRWHAATRPTNRVTPIL